MQRASRSLTKMFITAPADVLQTCVQAIAATGSNCRLHTLRLRPSTFKPDDCKIDLGLLLRAQHSISHLKIAPAIVHTFGEAKFWDAVLESQSIVKLGFI